MGTSQATAHLMGHNVNTQQGIPSLNDARARLIKDEDISPLSLENEIGSIAQSNSTMSFQHPCGPAARQVYSSTSAPYGAHQGPSVAQPNMHNQMYHSPINLFNAISPALLPSYNHTQQGMQQQQQLAPNKRSFEAFEDPKEDQTETESSKRQRM